MRKRRYYPKTEEKFFLPNDGTIEVWNPNPNRTEPEHSVQLPFGEYEDLRVRTALIRPKEYGSYEEVIIKSSDDVSRYLQGMTDQPQEAVVSILLDAQNAIIGMHEVHIGSTRASVVSMANLFQAAIVANASAVIIVHNHPSGNPRPSPEDRQIAAQMKEAGKLLQIDCLDFLVITPSGTTTCMP